MRPETDLWIFARGNVPNHSNGVLSSTDSKAHSTSQFCPTCRKAVLSILDCLSTLPVPPLHRDSLPALELAKQHEKEFPETGPDAKYPAMLKTFYRHLLDENVLTLGACHEGIVKICRDVGVIREEFPGARSPLDKFIFKIADLPEARDLPTGLHFREVTEKDVEFIQARAVLPRAKRTLLSLKSVAVFDEKERPIAWSFLGLDGSLTFLETDPEWRGKGIAKAIASKIFRENAPGLAMDEQGNAWAHADVYEGNVQSASVCRSLGGQVSWTLFWLRIDVGKAGQLSYD